LVGKVQKGIENSGPMCYNSNSECSDGIPFVYVREKSIMKRLLCLSALVISAALASSVMAQEPELDHVIYLPIVSVGEPSPYNLRAEDLVLQPSDMPSSYDLVEEDSGPIEFSNELLQMGAVDGYENWYADDSLSSPALVVGNPVIVFRTIHGAQEYIRYVEGNCAESPDFKRFIPISIGDEAIACEIYTEESLFPVTGYIIAFRRGNVASGIGTGAISSVADYNEALSFAQKSLNKIDTQIACCGR
jgi:hypothetical protein